MHARTPRFRPQPEAEPALCFGRSGDRGGRPAIGAAGDQRARNGGRLRRPEGARRDASRGAGSGFSPLRFAGELQGDAEWAQVARVDSMAHLAHRDRFAPDRAGGHVLDTVHSFTLEVAPADGTILLDGLELAGKPGTLSASLIWGRTGHSDVELHLDASIPALVRMLHGCCRRATTSSPRETRSTSRRAGSGAHPRRAHGHRRGSTPVAPATRSRSRSGPGTRRDGSPGETWSCRSRPTS